MLSCKQSGGRKHAVTLTRIHPWELQGHANHSLNVHIAYYYALSLQRGDNQYPTTYTRQLLPSDIDTAVRSPQNGEGCWLQIFTPQRTRPFYMTAIYLQNHHAWVIGASMFYGSIIYDCLKWLLAFITLIYSCQRARWTMQPNFTQILLVWHQLQSHIYKLAGSLGESH